MSGQVAVPHEFIDRCADELSTSVSPEGETHLDVLDGDSGALAVLKPSTDTFVGWCLVEHGTSLVDGNGSAKVNATASWSLRQENIRSG